MTNNLVCMFAGHDECQKDILFDTEEEIMAILKGESNTQSVCGFSYLQPLAVVWDIGNVKDWFVGFYLDGNGDETIRVDHMAKKAMHVKTNG